MYPLFHSFRAFWKSFLYSFTEPMASHVQRAQGQVGLFFTSWPPSETLEWFESFARPEFARMGEISTIDLTLPAGPVTNNDGKPFPHSMEPQLRKLGLATRMVAGVPSLPTEHVVCRKGDQLTSEQVRRARIGACTYTPSYRTHRSRFNY